MKAKALVSCSADFNIGLLEWPQESEGSERKGDAARPFMTY